MKTELEQAMEIRAAAREVLALARETNEESKLRQQEVNEMLDETRVMQKNMLLSHSRISYALASLLPKQVCDNLVMQNGSVIGFIDSGYAAESVAGMSEKVNNAFHNRDVFDIVHAINVLAMANTDVLHVFTYFMAHTNEVTVFVNPSNTVYEDGHKEVRLLNENVYLGKDDTLEKLLDIESQLTELIIEAREAAETKAPEQAVGEA
ncbi:TPA: hypothetical protein RQK07_003327 [Vibrio vulnificus]|nr:hypothetical protein [Vibrio vulnificus]HDY7689422.1 hypothetical protein [Vibrio vulnificus]